MALISLNPLTIYDMCRRVASSEQKYVLVIDNHSYHELSDEKKSVVRAYYVDQDPEDPDFANWIIPEAEIDAILDAKDIFYIFNTEQIAVDNCFDWFPRPENLPDDDHWIRAYVIKPDGTIPYVNDRLTPPS